MLDHSTRRVYRLYDFTRSQVIEPGSPYCVFGKVNSADKLYLVIESVKPNAKHKRAAHRSYLGRRRRRVIAIA